MTSLEAKYKKAQEQIAIMQSSGGKGETGEDFLCSKCNQLESELFEKNNIIEYQEKSINGKENLDEKQFTALQIQSQKLKHLKRNADKFPR